MPSTDNHYYTFVKGMMYTPLDDGRIHLHSRNYFMKHTSQEVITKASKILQKIMLYPESINSPTYFVVLDYNRPKLPITADDIVVPTYPKVGDMLKVAGDGDDVWFDYVISVDNTSRTCKVKFYISDVRDPQNTDLRQLAIKHTIHYIGHLCWSCLWLLEWWFLVYYSICFLKIVYKYM